MPQLPAFYVDNVQVTASKTTMVRGNVVSDIYGANITGIKITNADTVRAKNNQVVRLRATGQSTCYSTETCGDVLFVYNVASRADRGLNFTTITTLNVYNATVHNCTEHILTDSAGTFRNIALSAYETNKYYYNCTGFVISGGVTVDADYVRYMNLSALSSGNTFSAGSDVEEDEILYMDEPNDDFTPDHISVLVKTGTDNPLRVTDPSIGGIQSGITNEVTADRNYQYSLIDNDFWDVQNQKSPEMSYIKAFQSRGLANSEIAEKTVENDIYVKTMDSSLRFSELYPMNAYYANATKFNKRVVDMWYAGQNVGTLTAYNNSIGGYNLFPSFFKRMEDVDEGWIIAESYVSDNNYLIGMEDQKYGIEIDVLGLSTLSTSASGECYNNVMKSVADIAPVRWYIHHEPEPPGYILFTERWRNFESCTLTNMKYNDDYNIDLDYIDNNGNLVTPFIDTSTAGVSASGNVELSVLDRVYSDNVTRRIYYRQSSDEGWTEVTHPIGEVISLTTSAIQFRIVVEDVIRIVDYEFMGLCLRPYFIARDWTQQQPT